MLLNFSDRTRTGAFNMIWLQTKSKTELKTKVLAQNYVSGPNLMEFFCRAKKNNFSLYYKKLRFWRCL